MRKLLIFMLVLGLTSVANAGLIDVVVDEARGGHVDNNANGVIDASDDIRIKITTSLDLVTFGLGLRVTGPGTLGEYLVGGTLGPGPTAIHGNHVDDMMGGGMWVYSGIAGNRIANMTDAVFAGSMTGDLVWALTIHCTGPGPVNVDLMLSESPFAEPCQDVDGNVFMGDDLGDLVITQVPEPATLLLLGLGGLALLRKRKP